MRGFSLAAPPKPRDIAAFGTVEYWREFAEKLRVLGQFLTDSHAKNTVFEMAAAYDERARKIEQEQSPTKPRSTRRGFSLGNKTEAS
jgi:hypothetical protein